MVQDSSRKLVDVTAASDPVLHGEEIHDVWEQDYLSPEMNAFYDRAFEKIGESLGAPQGAPMLDAGCGYCFHAARLARLGFDVTGVDFSEVALGQARSYLDKIGMTGAIKLAQANLLDLPFEDGQWEFVHCWGVLMHIPNLEQALRELARVTKPGGRLVIMENNMRSLHFAGWDPMLRTVKRLLGRKNPRRQVTPRGIEQWYDKTGGEMLVRMTDMDFLERFLGEQGMTLEHRLPGQMTEVYTSLPFQPLKRAVQTFNEQWMERGGSAELAQGNICIFKKR